jgi:MFS family permease
VTTTDPLYTRAFWTAWAIHFTGAMSHAMFVLFPLYVLRLGGDELLIGLLLGVSLAFSVALRPLVGVLLDRLGRRRVLLGASLLNALSFPPFLLADDTGPLLWVLTVVHMILGGALFASYFTYAADVIPSGRRIEGLAIFGVAGMAPNGLGPALGETLIAEQGFAALFLAATVFGLVSFVLATLVPPREAGRERLPVHPPASGGRTLLSSLVPVLAATILFGAGINAAFFFVAPFTRELGIARAAPFFIAYAATTVTLRILGRRVLGRMGTHRVAIPAFAVFAVGLAGICLFPLPGSMVLAGMACGAGHGSLFPVLNALSVSRAPAHLHGVVISVHTAALDLGGVLGTPICGALARVLGYRAMFSTVAGGALCGLAIMLWDRARRA